MNYFLEIAYKGTRYHGWQIQENAVSVQQVINKVLADLFGQEINTIASGRTDTGVHAEQQFVQVDLLQEFTENHIYKVNRMLPYDIVVKNFYPVTDEANARFDAISRRYEYRISKRKNPFMDGLVCYFPRPLDVDRMNEASALLLEYEDFESFSKVKTSVDHFRCNISKAEWFTRNDLIIFNIEGNRFLRGMVRAIVGTLMEVGLGRMSKEEFRTIIECKDRKSAGRSAPAEGLYFCEVKYPEGVFKS
ncbi:MAG: tRNA pseudouridine(38-40) synthase TruA [Cytophagaceae bacterium]